MMDSLIREWTGETVIVRHDKPTGALFFIAVHSTRLGPAGGGTRMKSYPDTEAALKDALRLSEGMTYKFAGAGMDNGGAKAVIALPEDFNSDDRPGLLRRYGALVSQLGGLYSTGPDVGTTSEDMDIIGETGAPYVFGRTPAAGGSGSTGPLTAMGVFTGIKIACEYLLEEKTLKGKRILVQGTGSVGGMLIDYLRAVEAEVMFSDVDEGAIRRYRDEIGLQFVPAESVYSTECDVFAPCALGGVLNADTIPQLRCRIIAGGANNQLGGTEDAERLRERGILYAPDYVVNVGGALGIIKLETMDWNPDETKKEIVAVVRQTLRDIFAMSETEGISTEAAARRLAEKRLSETQEA